jgi:hypothetical protein
MHDNGLNVALGCIRVRHEADENNDEFESPQKAYAMALESVGCCGTNSVYGPSIDKFAEYPRQSKVFFLQKAFFPGETFELVENIQRWLAGVESTEQRESEPVQDLPENDPRRVQHMLLEKVIKCYLDPNKPIVIQSFEQLMGDVHIHTIDPTSLRRFSLSGAHLWSEQLDKMDEIRVREGREFWI